MTPRRIPLISRNHRRPHITHGTRDYIPAGSSFACDAGTRSGLNTGEPHGTPTRRLRRRKPKPVRGIAVRVARPARRPHARNSRFFYRDDPMHPHGERPKPRSRSIARARPAAARLPGGSTRPFKKKGTGAPLSNPECIVKLRRLTRRSQIIHSYFSTQRWTGRRTRIERRHRVRGVVRGEAPVDGVVGSDSQI